MFHTDDNKALIEWPFLIGLDNSKAWRDKPYEQRMEMVEFYSQEFLNAIEDVPF